MLLLLLAQTGTIETPTTAFLKAGVWGAAVVALSGVVVYLYRDTKTEIARRDAVIAALQAQHLNDLTVLQGQRTVEQATIQAQRVLDAQQMSERLLRVNEQTVGALTSVVHSMEAQKEAMQELRVAFKELGDEFRRSSPIRR